jgi:hypothetical protein
MRLGTAQLAVAMTLLFGTVCADVAFNVGCVRVPLLCQLACDVCLHLEVICFHHSWVGPLAWCGVCSHLEVSVFPITSGFGPLVWCGVHIQHYATPVYVWCSPCLGAQGYACKIDKHSDVHHEGEDCCTVGLLAFCYVVGTAMALPTCRHWYAKAQWLMIVCD